MGPIDIKDLEIEYYLTPRQSEGERPRGVRMGHLRTATLSECDRYDERHNNRVAAYKEIIGHINKQGATNNE